MFENLLTITYCDKEAGFYICLYLFYFCNKSWLLKSIQFHYNTYKAKEKRDKPHSLRTDVSLTRLNNK